MPASTPQARSPASGEPGTASATAVVHTVAESWPTTATGHAEAIRVTFDPAALDYGQLLDVFMGTHDPTQLNRQGNDVGTQYRSAIFPLDEAQRADAAAAIERWNADHPGSRAVTTIEGPATWYPAEGYHQEYWEGEGQRNPYCLATIPPKLMKLRKSFAAKVKPG